MYQKFIIIGNLGGDPEMRYFQDGTPVTNFSVAVNRRWGGDNPGEETAWFRVEAKGRLAENCNEYLRKGSQVMVEGRLKVDRETGGPRIWSGDDGIARATFEVLAFNVQFLSGGSRSEGASAQTGPTQPPSQPEPTAEDEIPF